MDWGMMQDTNAVVQTATASLACYPKGGPVGSKGHGSSKLRDGPCHHVCLRPRLRFGLTLSTLILVADAFLRFSWTLKLVGGGRLFPSNDAFVLCTQFLEVFRRAIWNLLRVEWENIKQKEWQSSKSKRDNKAHDSLSDHEDDYDTDDEPDYNEFKPLVGSATSHGVDSVVSPIEDIKGGMMEMRGSPSKTTKYDP
jgi:EXS family